MNKENQTCTFVWWAFVQPLKFATVEYSKLSVSIYFMYFFFGGGGGWGWWLFCFHFHKFLLIKISLSKSIETVSVYKFQTIQDHGIRVSWKLMPRFFFSHIKEYPKFRAISHRMTDFFIHLFIFSLSPIGTFDKVNL